MGWISGWQACSKEGLREAHTQGWRNRTSTLPLSLQSFIIQGQGRWYIGLPHSKPTLVSQCLSW